MALNTSSVEEVLKPYFGWIERWIAPLRMTGIDVTGRGLTGRGPDHIRKHVMRMRFSYYSTTKCSTVVQVPRLPGVTEGHVIPEVHVIPLGACMCN